MRGRARGGGERLTSTSLELVEEVKQRHGGEAGGRGTVGSLQVCHWGAVLGVQVNQPLHQQHTHNVVSLPSVHWHPRVSLEHDL